ncbi:MAG: peptide chain release factor 3 [Synechococcus sp.]|nr:peptide chain release factor 3 [Synechococcus sp.]
MSSISSPTDLRSAASDSTDPGGGGAAAPPAGTDSGAPAGAGTTAGHSHSRSQDHDHSHDHSQGRDPELVAAVARRRNFAIISHPDAGKTTLTEKLLLYGGAIQQAGAVKAKGEQRKVTSDWMELEKQRGISITSTVLQFDYAGSTVNLLDTPGHQDFSEDTYRTLAAADNAVMLEDAAKGLEPQTRKLFEVCRLRQIPIFTFINKMDRPGREPLELLDEIESELGLACWPVNWPIGSGDRFRGVIDRRSRRVILFDRAERGRQAAEVCLTVEEARSSARVEPELLDAALEELELLEGAGAGLDLELVHSGDLSPVFFGSAMTNFGVRPFLDAFLELAQRPTPRLSSSGPVDPVTADFSGFVFKLQANMDPRHRDRVAFVRVCSGRFEKDMTVQHARTGRSIRLSRPQKLFGQEREVVEDAYPGDVIGLNNPGMFAIGDTLYVGSRVEYEGIPCFSPEIFAWLRNPNPSAFKSFRKGVNELREEGAVQVLYDTDPSKRDPILAAVGQLQLEVVHYRLENEYGVKTRLEPLEFSLARWVSQGWPALEAVGRLFNCKIVRDCWDRPVLLFRNGWNLNQLLEDHPELALSSVAPVVSGVEPIAL